MEGLPKMGWDDEWMFETIIMELEDLIKEASSARCSDASVELFEFRYYLDVDWTARNADHRRILQLISSDQGLIKPELACRQSSRPFTVAVATSIDSNEYLEGHSILTPATTS